MPRAIADKATDGRCWSSTVLHEAGERRGVIYNTAVLTGPAGHIGSYRKVHVGVGERLIWRVGYEWPVFDCDAGRIGMLICWDKDFPEATRELTLRGAEVLVAPTAWGQLPGTGVDGDSLSVRMMSLPGAGRRERTLVCLIEFRRRARRTEYIGHSQIVSPLGEVLATSGAAGVGLTIATVDIEAGIAQAYAAWEGAYLIRDGRPRHTGLCVRRSLV